ATLRAPPPGARRAQRAEVAPIPILQHTIRTRAVGVAPTVALAVRAAIPGSATCLAVALEAPPLRPASREWRWVQVVAPAVATTHRVSRTRAAVAMGEGWSRSGPAPWLERGP